MELTAAIFKRVWTRHLLQTSRRFLLPNYLAFEHFISDIICNLFTWSKQKWLFWRTGLYPANQSNPKSFQKALIGWEKATFVLIMQTGQW